MYDCSKYTVNSSTDNAQFIHIRLVEYVQHHFLGGECSWMYHYPWCHLSFSFLHFSSSCLPACFRSETRILLMKLKFKTCRIHSTWNTLNQNLPRRISLPTFDVIVVIIRCQSALLCRSSILKHLYFFLQKTAGSLLKKGLISLKNTLQVQSRGWFRFFFHFMFSSCKK